jgi:hypothetical protein
LAWRGFVLFPGDPDLANSIPHSVAAGERP